MSEGPGENRPELPSEGDAAEASRPEQSGAGQLALPDNPFSTETVEYIVGDELLGVRLRGGPITETQIPTGVAGPFLYRLHELVQSIAVNLLGRTPGRRGPLPEVPGVGLLAVRQVAFGHSVTFHFTIGAPEQTQLMPGGDVSSITGEAMKVLAEIITSGARGDEEALYAQTRKLSRRAGENLERLVEVLVQREVDSLWRFSNDERAVALTSTRAFRTKAMLEYEELPSVKEQEVRGYLYRVDGREHTFVLDPAVEGEEKMIGTYPDHLREDIREAWDHQEVVARVRTTHYFLRRQLDPDRVEVELIEILDIVDG